MTRRGKALLFMLFLFFLAYPPRTEGAVQAYLRLEKAKYLTDDVVFYEVEIRNPGPSPAYLQFTFVSPMLAILNEANELVNTPSLSGNGNWPPQTLNRNGKKIYINAVKLLPGEVYQDVGSSPPELIRKNVKPGLYRAFYPLSEYDERSGQFKDITLISSPFEVVEPTGKEARADSFLNVFLSLSGKVRQARLREMLAKYPELFYSEPILYHGAGFCDESMLLGVMTKRPNAMVSEFYARYLIIKGFKGDWSKLADGSDFMKETIGPLLQRFSGTKVAQAIQAIISNLRSQPGYLVFQRERLAGSGK